MSKRLLISILFIFFELSCQAGNMRNPVGSIDDSGNTTAVWIDIVGGVYAIQSAQLPSGGSWSLPITISKSGDSSSNPQIVSDSLGNVVAIWSALNNTNNTRNLYGSMLPSGGSWTAPVLISLPTEDVLNSYQLKSTNNGNIITIWSAYLSESQESVIRSSNAIFGGSWTAPVTISK